MAVIPSGFGQVNLKFSGVGLPTGAEVTFGIQVLTEDDPSEVATTVVGLWDASLKERTPTAVTLQSVLVKFGPNDTGPFFEVGASIAGTGSSAHVNPNMAILLSKATALGGRANRGRWFYPVAEDQVGQAGVLNTAEVTELNTQITEFLAALTAADIPMVILHTSEAITPTTVLSMSTAGTTATQRRRLRR